MAKLQDVATAAGVHRVECPYCHRKFSIVKAFDLVFQAILKLVKSGNKVAVTGFGTFDAKLLKGRSHATPITPTGEVKFSDLWILKFRQHQTARDFLNDEGGVTVSTKAARKKATAKKVGKKVAKSAGRKVGKKAAKKAGKK